MINGFSRVMSSIKEDGVFLIRDASDGVEYKVMQCLKYLIQ